MSACPECGRAVADSDPNARPGWPWQRKQTPAAFVQTAWQVATGPTRAAQTLRFGPANADVRRFLLGAITLIWLASAASAWAAQRLVGQRLGLPEAPEWIGPAILGIVMAQLGVGMAVVEAAGLTFLGGRRGWTLRFAGCLRVCAYATIGWLPGAVAMSAVLAGGWLWLNVAPRASIDRFWALFPAWLSAPALVGVGALILLMVCCLGFEVLAARLARACRYVLPDRRVEPEPRSVEADLPDPGLS